MHRRNITARKAPARHFDPDEILLRPKNRREGKTYTNSPKKLPKSSKAQLPTFCDIIFRSLSLSVFLLPSSPPLPLLAYTREFDYLPFGQGEQKKKKSNPHSCVKTKNQQKLTLFSKNVDKRRMLEKNFFPHHPNYYYFKNELIFWRKFIFFSPSTGRIVFTAGARHENTKKSSVQYLPVWLKRIKLFRWTRTSTDRRYNIPFV